MFYNDTVAIAGALSGHYGVVSAADLVDYGQTVIVKPGAKTDQGVMLTGAYIAGVLGDEYAVYPLGIEYGTDRLNDDLGLLDAELDALGETLEDLDDGFGDAYGKGGSRVRKRYLRVLARYRKCMTKLGIKEKKGRVRRCDRRYRKMLKRWQKMQRKGIDTSDLVSPEQARAAFAEPSGPVQGPRVIAPPAQYVPPVLPMVPQYGPPGGGGGYFDDQAALEREMASIAPSYGADQRQLVADLRAEADTYALSGIEHDYFGLGGSDVDVRYTEDSLGDDDADLLGRSDDAYETAAARLRVAVGLPPDAVILRMHRDWALESENPKIRKIGKRYLHELAIHNQSRRDDFGDDDGFTRKQRRQLRRGMRHLSRELTQAERAAIRSQRQMARMEDASLPDDDADLVGDLLGMEAEFDDLGDDDADLLGEDDDDLGEDDDLLGDEDDDLGDDDDLLGDEGLMTEGEKRRFLRNLRRVGNREMIRRAVAAGHGSVVRRALRADPTGATIPPEIMTEVYPDLFVREGAIPAGAPGYGDDDDLLGDEDDDLGDDDDLLGDEGLMTEGEKRRFLRNLRRVGNREMIRRAVAAGHGSVVRRALRADPTGATIPPEIMTEVYPDLFVREGAIPAGAPGYGDDDDLLGEADGGEILLTHPDQVGEDEDVLGILPLLVIPAAAGLLSIGHRKRAMQRWLRKGGYLTPRRAKRVARWRTKWKAKLARARKPKRQERLRRRIALADQLLATSAVTLGADGAVDYGRLRPKTRGTKGAPVIVIAIRKRPNEGETLKGAIAQYGAQAGHFAADPGLLDVYSVGLMPEVYQVDRGWSAPEAMMQIAQHTHVSDWFGVDLEPLKELDAQISSAAKSVVGSFVGAKLKFNKELNDLGVARDRLIASGASASSPDVLAVESRFRAKVREITPKYAAELEATVLPYKAARDAMVRALGAAGFSSWDIYDQLAGVGAAARPFDERRSEERLGFQLFSKMRERAEEKHESSQARREARDKREREEYKFRKKQREREDELEQMKFQMQMAQMKAQMQQMQAMQTQAAKGGPVPVAAMAPASAKAKTGAAFGAAPFPIGGSPPFPPPRRVGPEVR